MDQGGASIAYNEAKGVPLHIKLLEHHIIDSFLVIMWLTHDKELG